MHGPRSVCGLLLLVSACAHKPSSLEEASFAPTPASPPAAAPTPAAPAANPGPAPAPSAAPAPTPAATGTPAPVAPPTPTSSAPTISTSAGEPYQMLALWPRVIPKSINDDAIVGQLQQHVVATIQRAEPAKKIDIRPNPQRSCRRAGCDATAVSVLFAENGGGCVAVALVTLPGPHQTLLIPWAGDVTLKRDRIPFRDPPESEVKIRDHVPCGQLLQTMATRDAEVIAAIQAATP